MNSAPLLEEQRDASGSALTANRDDPVSQHRACAYAALAADDHPMNVRQVNRAQVLQ